MAYTRFGVRRLHRCVGLACAAFFLSTVATGVLLMFQREVGLTGAAGSAASDASLRGVDLALHAATAAPLRRVPTFLSPAPDARHAWQLVSLPESGDEGAAEISSIDAASGAVLSTRRVDETAAGVLLRLHLSFFAGAPGHVAALIMGLGIVALGVSGFTMLTGRWRVARSNPLRATHRWPAIHRWVGVTGAAFLLAWGVTGTLLISRVVLHDRAVTLPRPLVALPLGVPIASFIASAVARPAWYGAYTPEVSGIGLPTSLSPYVEITLLHRDAAPWHKYSHVRFDRRSGALLERVAAEDPSVWGRVMAAADSIHKGQSDPPAVHCVYAVAVLFPLVLVITGPGAWLSRRSQSRRARERHGTP